MKLRTLFVTDRKQVHLKDGWEIERVDIVFPHKGKAQFAVLLKKKPNEPKKRIGFKTR